jgi:hypothetical protein
MKIKTPISIAAAVITGILLFNSWASTNAAPHITSVERAITTVSNSFYVRNRSLLAPSGFIKLPHRNYTSGGMDNTRFK